MKIKSFQIRTMNALLFQEIILLKVGLGLKSGRLTIQVMWILMVISIQTTSRQISKPIVP
jgi:hypothetical protein